VGDPGARIPRDPEGAGKSKAVVAPLTGLSYDVPVRVRVLGQDTGACFGADFTTATRSSDTELRARIP
jgi:hypothetical protein